MNKEDNNDSRSNTSSISLFYVSYVNGQGVFKPPMNSKVVGPELIFFQV